MSEKKKGDILEIGLEPELATNVVVLKESLSYFEQAQKLAHQLNDNAAEARIFSKLGETHYHLYLNDESIITKILTSYQNSINLFRNIGDNTNLIGTSIKLAKVQREFGKNKEARESYERTSTLAEQIGEKSALW